MTKRELAEEVVCLKRKLNAAVKEMGYAIGKSEGQIVRMLSLIENLQVDMQLLLGKMQEMEINHEK